MVTEKDIFLSIINIKRVIFIENLNLQILTSNQAFAYCITPILFLSMSEKV